VALRAALGPLAGEFSLAPNLAARDGYFAGDDDTRLAALAHALADPEIDAILCARGGYGLTRLLHRLDPARLAPKLLVGFSDVTALLAWALVGCNLASVHGPVLTQLGELPDEDRERLILLLAGHDPGALVAEAAPSSAAAASRARSSPPTSRSSAASSAPASCPALAGCILALEEVGERPYRIDRALTQLLTSGALRGIRGVALGQLHALRGAPDRQPRQPQRRGRRPRAPRPRSACPSSPASPSATRSRATRRCRSAARSGSTPTTPRSTCSSRSPCDYQRPCTLRMNSYG
jgi:hypothetical protein